MTIDRMPFFAALFNSTGKGSLYSVPLSPNREIPPLFPSVQPCATIYRTSAPDSLQRRFRQDHFGPQLRFRFDVMTCSHVHVVRSPPDCCGTCVYGKEKYYNCLENDCDTFVHTNRISFFDVVVRKSLCTLLLKDL